MSKATSEVDICNMALSLLRQQGISSISSPSSDTEILCALFYDNVRRYVLRSQTWNCALKRRVLAASTEAPAFGYSKKFLLPNDFLRLASINESEEGLDYEIEDGYLLLNTSETSLNLKYVYNKEAVSGFDAGLVMLLAYELALHLAPQITDSNTYIGRVQEIKSFIENEARGVDGQERPPRKILHSKYLNARRGMGANLFPYSGIDWNE